MSDFNFDLLNYPYTSRRTTTVANNGMVVTTQPLASQAGLDILKKGGNAVDLGAGKLFGETKKLELI